MNEQTGREYYLSHKSEILTQFDTHSKAWRPILVDSYGDELADTVLKETRQQYEALLPDIPYI